MDKKVLFVSNDFPPALGGIAQVMGQMSRSLNPENVCALAQQHPQAKEYDEKSPFPIYRIPYKSGTKVNSLLSVAQFAKAAQQIKAKEKCDLVFYDKAFPLGLISHQPMHPNVPYVLQAYGNDLVVPRSSLGIRLQKRILQNAAGVVAISEFTRELLLNHGVAPDKISIIHPKADFERFNISDGSEPLRKELGLKNKKIITTVGRLVRRKGFDNTIKALPEVIKHIPDAVYIIVGNGPDLNYLKELAEKLGVSENVIFKSDCDDKQLPHYYQLCDVFCMPSRFIIEKGDVEGFGIVFLEANTCRKPVVGGNTGGQPDAIEDGKSGLLCNPESPDDIADKLIQLLSDPARAMQMGAYGYDRVKNNFQAHHYKNELENFFSSL